MAIPWVPITKYSAVASLSCCLTAGICLATVNQVGEGEKDDLTNELLEIEKELEENQETPEKKVITLTAKVKELTEKANNQGAKLYRYLLKEDCYEKEIKRQLNIGSRWWYGDDLNELVKRCEHHKINIPKNPSKP